MQNSWVGNDVYGRQRYGLGVVNAVTVRILAAMKPNSPVVGFIIGLLLPVLGALAVYGLLFRNIPMADFIHRLSFDFQAAAKVLSLSLLINALPFMYFNRYKLESTSRGIFIATMLYFVLYVLLKFVWG